MGVSYAALNYWLESVDKQTIPNFKLSGNDAEKQSRVFNADPMINVQSRLSPDGITFISRLKSYGNALEYDGRGLPEPLIPTAVGWLSDQIGKSQVTDVYFPFTTEGTFLARLKETLKKPAFEGLRIHQERYPYAMGVTLKKHPYPAVTFTLPDNPGEKLAELVTYMANTATLWQVTDVFFEKCNVDTFKLFQKELAPQLPPGISVHAISCEDFCTLQHELEFLDENILIYTPNPANGINKTLVAIEIAGICCIKKISTVCMPKNKTSLHTQRELEPILACYGYPTQVKLLEPHVPESRLKPGIKVEKPRAAAGGGEMMGAKFRQADAAPRPNPPPAALQPAKTPTVEKRRAGGSLVIKKANQPPA
jgi:hypothetical protein